MIATTNQLPHALEAEQSILGAIMREPEAMAEVARILTSEMAFYSPQHREIYRAALQLFQNSEPVDRTTIINKLTQSGQLSDVGGYTYLVQLIEEAAWTSQVSVYARIVLDKAKLRKIISECNRATQTCYDQGSSGDEVSNSLVSSLLKVQENSTSGNVKSVSELLPDTMQDIEDLSEGRIVAIKTGFSNLDRIFYGFEPSTLSLIAGRPSQGKTQLALQIAHNVALTGTPVTFISLEMSDKQLMRRLVCLRAGISVGSVRGHQLGTAAWNRLTEAQNALNGLPLYIRDQSYLTPIELRAIVHQDISRRGVGLVIIDYLQLISSERRYENRNSEIGHVSRSLKMIAKDTGLPIVAACQLRRDADSQRKPRLSDLRESGSLEQDADNVLLISHGTDGLAELILGKCRDQARSRVSMIFQDGRWQDENTNQEERLENEPNR